MRRALLCLLLASCATAKPAVAISGESLIAVGEEFRATSTAFVALCSGKVLSEKTCSDYRDFGVQFKKAYAVANAGWALAASDAGVFDASAWGEILKQLAQFTTIAVHEASAGVP